MLSFCDSFGNNTVDVVYLKVGEVRMGDILEIASKESLKLQTVDGDIIVISMSEIDRIETNMNSKTKREF